MTERLPASGADGDAGGQDDAASRILDAAFALIGRHGLRRTSLDDIAREAGVSRATLFRRFPTRAALLDQLMEREVRRFLDELAGRLAPLDDPAERLVETFVLFVGVARNHPLLRNLLRTDRDTALPLLTVSAGPILAIGNSFMIDELRRAEAAGRQLTTSPPIAAELLTRLSHSFLLLPDSAMTLDDPDALRHIGRTTLVRLIFADWTPSR